MACEPADTTLMVAAIDFGTTYSGYAFSTSHDFSINKLDIKANQVWQTIANLALNNNHSFTVDIIVYTY
jgi:hypothetical protein